MPVHHLMSVPLWALPLDKFQQRTMRVENHPHLLFARLLHQGEGKQRGSEAGESALQELISRLAPDCAMESEIHAHGLQPGGGPSPLHALDLLRQFALVLWREPRAA